jgi:hypothetical protein
MDSNQRAVRTRKHDKSATLADGRAAESGAVLPDSVPIDPDLAALIGAWPTLPAAVRRQIMAMTRDGE